MSVVTEVAVIAHFTEGEAISALNTFLGQRPGESPPLGMGFRLNAGPRVSDLTVWGGGYNYLDRESFMEAARSAPWRFPDWVVIICLGESDDQPFVGRVTP